MIIGLTGRIASGKGIAAQYLKEKGIEYYTMSQVVREEATKRDIELTRKNLQDLGNKLRKERGGGIWAKKIIEKIDSQKDYIIDGIRNPAEINELKKATNFYLIAIDADQKIRYQRLLERDKPSDPKNWQGFLEIDQRDLGKGEPEWGQQVKACMEKADFILINNSNLTSFQEDIDKIYKNIKNQTN